MFSIGIYFENEKWKKNRKLIALIIVHSKQDTGEKKTKKQNIYHKTNYFTGKLKKNNENENQMTNGKEHSKRMRTGERKKRGNKNKNITNEYILFIPDDIVLIFRVKELLFAIFLSLALFLFFLVEENLNLHSTSTPVLASWICLQGCVGATKCEK